MKTYIDRVHTLKTTALPSTQRGASLIIALVMLVLISILAVGGMQGSILQERMASNAQDGAIGFQAAEAGLRQAEVDILNNVGTRQNAYNTALVGTPWNWDGANPAPSGTGNAGAGVNAQPVYHLARLADVCPEEQGNPCFERYEVTVRGQGGSGEAITILQSTVLLAPE